MHQAFELSATRVHDARQGDLRCDPQVTVWHALGTAAIMIIKFVVQNQDPPSPLKLRRIWARSGVHKYVLLLT